MEQHSKLLPLREDIPNSNLRKNFLAIGEKNPEWKDFIDSVDALGSRAIQIVHLFVKLGLITNEKMAAPDRGIANIMSNVEIPNKGKSVY